MRRHDLYIVDYSRFRLDLSHQRVRLLENHWRGRTAMSFVLLIGFLGLTACAVFVTVRFRTLDTRWFRTEQGK
jgi:hypothetical protein